MSKLIAPVQPLILKTAGQLPTIPIPNTIMPDDSRFNIESDLMVGQFAYNVIDDIWYYRGYSSILPLNQSTEISADQVEVWQSNKLYSAGNVYVSYVNPSSPNEQFHIEAIYRCIIDALAGESPESHPNKWEYQGQYVDLSYIKFTDLQDTPENYTGHNNKVLVVNAAGDKIEFTADIKNLSSVQFDLGSVETITEGKLKWNSIDGTLDLGLPGGQSVLQIGQETVIRANNAETFPILNGQAVYISGSTGTRVEIKLATASDSSKTQVVGIATQNINPGSSGYVTLVGLVRGLNTLGMSYGVPVWLDTTNGGITQTVPQAPNISVFIGYVVTVHATEGVLFVRPTTIPRLSSLSDVKDTPLTESGQIPVWDNTQGYFDFTRNIEDYALTEDIITSHNDLNDIQGGTTGEYYHLTQAEYESLGATPGHTIVDSSTTYPQRSKLKFIGGVTVSDDSVNDITEISVIPTSTSAWEADTGNDEWGQIKDNHIKPKSSKKVHVEHIDKLADEEIRIYGYLYKWYTITDYRGFTSGGNWRVPTKSDWENLLTFVGSDPGTKLKSAAGWNINTGTDDYNFRMLPGGVRSITSGASVFALEGTNAYQWASTEAVLPFNAEIFTFSDSSSNVFNGTISKKAGCSVRLVRPATDTELNFPDGQFVIAPYIGNNGRRYKTVKMGTLIWTAENLIETHLADGSEIPDLTSPVGWNLNDTEGRCSYNNVEYMYAFYNIRGKLHKVAITGSYLDLYNLPEGGTGGSSTIPMNYQSRIVGANTVDIPLNEMVTIQEDLLDTDSVTVTLNSFLVPISNQYTLHISTGDTVPNVTHPIGTIWQNGAEPELSPNRKYTFVYEYVQVESGDWKIYGVAGEFHSEGPTSGYVTEAPIDNKLYGRKDGAWEEITDIGGSWLEQFFTYDVETDEMTFTKSLAVQGSLYQQGSAYETHVEHLFSKNDFIILREDAVSGLPSNQLSGFKILKANGTVNLIFGAGNDAIGRIGWEGGSLQAIATRADTPTNNGIAVWNNAISRFDTPYLVSDFPRKAENATIAATWTFTAGQRIAADNSYLAIDGSTITLRLGLVKKAGNQPVYAVGNASAHIWAQANAATIANVSTTAYAELMRLNSTGLGIGINAPTEKLEVAGNLKLNILSAVNGTFSDISFNGSDTNLGGNPTARIRFTRTASGALGNISFQVRRSDNFTTAERMLISNDEVLFHTRINSPTFISGFAGSGWRLDATDNHLTVDKLTVRGQMSVYESVVNQIRATNGSLWVSDAIKTTTAFRESDWDNRYIHFNFDNDNGNRACPFIVNDIVQAQRFNGRSIVKIVGVVYQSFGTYFRVDTNNYMTAYNGSLTDLDGLEFVRIGHTSDTSRQGAIYLTSSDNGAPFIDVIDGVNGTTQLINKTRLRIGKLSGISGQSGYGIWGSRDGVNEAFAISSNGYARIAGWSFTNNQLVSPTVGGGFIQMSVDGYPRIQVYRNEDNHVNIYHYSSSDWGIAGRKDGAWVFRLGGINQIAGVNFNHQSIWTNRWALNADGSGSFANGKIRFTADGGAEIDGSLITQYITTNYIQGLELNFTKGTIGGFKIGTGSLIGGDPNGDRFVLYPDYSGFAAFISADYTKWAGIGSDVLPAGAGGAVGRFDNLESKVLGTNIGLVVRVQNARRNIAMTGIGDIYMDGEIVGSKHNFYFYTSTSVVILGQFRATWLIQAAANAGSGVSLPRIGDVRTELGLSTSTPFAVRVTYIGHRDSSKDITIWGRNTSVSGMSGTEFPQILDNNASNSNGRGLGHGDIQEFMLVFDGVDYSAYLLNYRY